MPETVSPVQFVFIGKTVDELRNELNRLAESIARGFTTDTLTTKGVVFIPVEGPHRAADAKLGQLFVRKQQWDDPRSMNVLHIVLQSPYTGTGKTLALYNAYGISYDGVVGSLTK